MGIVYDGTVVWFNLIRGFGWIRRPGWRDIFFHATGVVQDGSPPLKAGEIVTFEIVPESKGPKAINIKRRTGNEQKGNRYGNSQRVYAV
jgi:CspA family cold shock protein